MTEESPTARKSQFSGVASIPLSIPNLSGREAEYLTACVCTGRVSTPGPFVGKFERMLSEMMDGAHVVAMSSGTAALHLGVLAAGVGPNDEVIAPALTFMASCAAIRYADAYPVIVDVDPRTGKWTPLQWPVFYGGLLPPWERGRQSGDRP